MIYHSTHSDDYLWYLILRGKQKNEKKNWSEQKFCSLFTKEQMKQTFNYVGSVAVT